MKTGNLPWIAGDQHPLKWGIARVFLLKHKYPSTNVIYLWHNVDGQSAISNFKKSTKKVLINKPPFSLRTMSGSSRYFTLMSLALPFGMPQLAANEITLGTANASKLGTELQLIRDVMNWKLDVVSEVDTHLKANIGMPGNKEIVLQAYGLFIQRLYEISDSLPTATSLASKLRIKLIEGVLKWWSLVGHDVGDLYFMLGKLVLGHGVTHTMQQRSTDFIGRMGLSEDTFSPGQLFAIYKGSDRYLHRGDVGSVSKPLFLAPRAHLFYALLRSTGRMVSGGVPYEAEANAFSLQLGLALHDQAVVKFKPGEVLKLRGLVPDMSKLWRGVVQDTPFRRELVGKAITASLQFWLSDENLDMVTLWVLGGYAAMNEVLRNASVEIKG